MRILYFIITSSLMIGLMLLFRRLFRKKLSANVIYGLWFIVFLRLLIPFGYWDVPVFGTAAEFIYRPTAIVEQYFNENETETFTTNEEISKFESPVIESQPLTEGIKIYDAVIPEPATSKQENSYSENNVAPSITKESSVTPKTIILSIWLAGSLVAAGYVILQNRKLRKQVDTMEVVDQRDGIDICVSKKIKTPCLFGLHNPKIIVTEAVLADAVLYEYAITHELEHYRHKDHIYNADRIFMCILYWWNPLVWYAAKCVSEDAELACDERVLKNKTADERKKYGYALLQMMENAQNSPFCMATSYFGGKNTTKQRIESIARKTKTKKYVLIPVILILVVLNIVGCVYPSEKSYLKTTDWEDNDIKGWMITETEFPYSVQDNFKSYVLYSEIYEYGELVKTEVLGAAKLDDLSGNIKLQHKFSKSDEPNKFVLEMDNFGIEMESILSNYPTEGGYSFTALQSDKKIEIMPEKSIILSTDYRTKNTPIQTYDCLKLSDYTEDELKEQFKNDYVVGLYRIVFSEMESSELYEKYSDETPEMIPISEYNEKYSKKEFSTATQIIKQADERLREGYKEVKLTYVDNAEVGWNYYSDNPWASVAERDALAQAALKELYTLTGFNVEECTYTTDGRSRFIFGKSASNIKKSIAFYSRDYGFTLCGDSTPYMGYVNARRVHYSDVQQLDSPYQKEEYSGHGAIAAWFLEHSGVYQGEKIIGFDAINLDDTVYTHIKLNFAGGYYIVVMDEKIESVADIMGPYYE